MWARGFRYYFTPLPGCFSPFPHGTSSLSVAREYLALRGGPRRFRPGFPCPAVLRNSSRKAVRFRLLDCYHLWCDFPFASTSDRLCNSAGTLQGPVVGSYNPRSETAATCRADRVWAIPVSLATTQGIVSFPPATEMFQFADLPLAGLCIPPAVTGRYPSRVSPFGHSRITACSQLPETFRRLPRPSSALGAKASTPCPV